MDAMEKLVLTKWDCGEYLSKGPLVNHNGKVTGTLPTAASTSFHYRSETKEMTDKIAFGSVIISFLLMFLIYFGGILNIQSLYN